jgi:phosphoribosylformylglycinamidine synthase subunit PurL
MQINKDNLAKYNVGLTLEEATKVEKEILKREPTVTELVAFGIEGSEHSSYKSSRQYLKLLPTSAPNVILGPCEDSGIIRIAPDWGIVISHESHNHPSQIVPYEGAATGIGGIVRDVICMGAKVIATADGLRFGEINSNHTKWIHERVVAGISGYGNPIGVANIGGDLYYNDSFNDNCLVNVVSMGVVRESEVIHSYAPKDAEGYNFILLGKPTDNSGFGGASFASFELDENKKEQNKGAVQEPNAFLKRHLFESTYDLFKILKEKNLLSKVGFKDLGAGGILCASVELADAAGYGGEVDIDKIHVGMENLDPSVILCSETQERFMWVADDATTDLILKHYNEKWDLPKVSHGARASAIGKVKKGNYQVKYQGKVILDARAEDITRGLHYDREIKEIKKELREPEIRINDFNKILLAILAHENIACRKPVYEKYDKQVQGITVIESGLADAGVMAPLIDEGLNVGMAFSLDGNPRHGRISPFWQGANAVVEAMRNVAAVGAIPWTLTDCLNYGNPEKPEQMWQFVEGVKGVAEAAKNVHLKEFPDSPTPIISGNVSFYNQSKNQSIDPSANVACLGKIDDYHNAITFDLKEKNSALYLVGARKNELGASVFYNLFNELGANVPKPNFKEVEKEIFALTDCIEQKLILSAHDISDGGLVVALAEMSFGGRAEKEMGLEVDLSSVALAKEDLTIQQKLFSETGGFVFEVKSQSEEKVRSVFQKRGVKIYRIGQTRKDNRFIIKDKNNRVIDLPVKKMAESWFNGLRSKFI